MCHLAGDYARSLKQQIDEDKERVPSIDTNKEYHFDDEEVLCAEIAGLCHDLGIQLAIINFDNKAVICVRI